MTRSAGDWSGYAVHPLAMRGNGNGTDERPSATTGAVPLPEHEGHMRSSVTVTACAGWPHGSTQGKRPSVLFSSVVPAPGAAS